MLRHVVETLYLERQVQLASGVFEDHKNLPPVTHNMFEEHRFEPKETFIFMGEMRWPYRDSSLASFLIKGGAFEMVTLLAGLTNGRTGTKVS